MISETTKITKKWYGIANQREHGAWYSINILFGANMVKLTLYTPRTKFARVYFYKSAEFEYCVNEGNLITFNWFFGLTITCK